MQEQMISSMRLLKRNSMERLLAQRFDLGAFVLDLKNGLQTTPNLRSGGGEQCALTVQVLLQGARGTSVRFGFPADVQKSVESIDARRRERHHSLSENPDGKPKGLTRADKHLFGAIIDVRAVLDLLDLLREQATPLERSGSLDEARRMLNVELQRKSSLLLEQLQRYYEPSAIKALLKSGDEVFARIGALAVTSGNSAMLSDALLTAGNDSSLPDDVRRLALSQRAIPDAPLTSLGRMAGVRTS
jgi:hypothetical protein